MKTSKEIQVEWSAAMRWRMRLDHVKHLSCLAVGVAAMCFSAHAAEADPFPGSGTAADPYQIATVEDIQKLRDIVTTNACAGTFFKQTADIDLDQVSWAGIGAYYHATESRVYFEGIYDGAGNTITNVTLLKQDFAGGVFNTICNGAVSNLTVCIAGPSTVGAKAVGGIVGSAYGNVVFENCTVKGAITGTSMIGGFVAVSPVPKSEDTGPMATLFKNCVNEASISQTNNKNNTIGGFIAQANVQADFVNCVNKGTIAGHKELSFGGFIGAGKFTLDTCANEGVISGANGSQFTGSATIVGVAGTNTCRTDRKAMGTAGIPGVQYATVDGAVATFVSSLSLDGTKYLVMASLTNDPLAFDAIGQSISFDVSLYTSYHPFVSAAPGLVLTESKSGNVYTYAVVAAPFVGTGTQDTPYQIADSNDLIRLADLVKKGNPFAGVYFKQTADVDMILTEGSWDGIGTKQTASGTGTYGCFCGNYDGDNHSISNLTTTATGNYNGVLFQSTACGTIKNLTVHAIVNKSGGFGIVSGNASGSVFVNVTTQGSILGTHHCGGFTAFGQWLNNASIFSNCVNEATVASSKSAGGFQGKPQTSATYVNCINKGTIGAEGKMGGDGGLAGFASSAVCAFEDCSNEGMVLGTFPELATGASAIIGTVTFDGARRAFGGRVDIDAWFATVNSGVGTIISTNDLVKGNTYKLESQIGYALYKKNTTIITGTVEHVVFTLEAADDFLKIDNEFGFATNYMHVAVADGLKLEITEAEGVLTYTAIGTAPVIPTVVPGQDIDLRAGAKADEFVATVEASKATILKAPEDVIAAGSGLTAYQGLFTATLVGNTVKFILNSDGTNYVNTAVQAADAEALAAVLASSESTATLTVKAPVAGFYYSLKQGGDLQNLAFGAGDMNKLCGKTAITFTLNKSGTAGFYQIFVTPAPLE